MESPMFYWREKEPDHRFTTITGMDPRADFLLGPGFEDFQPAGPLGLIPFILVAHSPATLAFVEGLLRPPAGDDRVGPTVLPISFARHRDGQFKLGETITLMAQRSFFERLARPGGEFEAFRVAPKQIQLCLPVNGPSQPDWQPFDPLPPVQDPVIGPPAGGWPPETVIVAIIDDGIAFANARFRAVDQTSRVACFWHQDGVPKSPTVQYGSELLKSDIDQLLTSNTLGGVVDEDAVYRKSGLIDFTRTDHKAAAWRLAHGTHVLDIAAGPEPITGQVPANRPIIAVQLPVAATAKQTGAGLENWVTDAIDYIRHRALALAGNGPPLPVVINFSYGTMAGPHDGTSVMEQAVDVAVQANAPVTRIVLPAGNSLQGRGHEQISFGFIPDTVCMHWRVQPDDAGPSLLQIWMPFADVNPPAASRITVSIKPPDFVASPELGEVDGAAIVLENDLEVVCEACYSFQPPPTGRGVFNIFLQPTVRQLPTVPAKLAARVASAGVWTITLHNKHLAPEDVVHAWIERDGQLYGYPRRGRQSYFDEKDYVRFDATGVNVDDDPIVPVSNLRRNGMISAIATGSEPIVVGGFRRKDLRLAAYSAGGPITATEGGVLPPGLDKPDALMVSDDSYVHFGVLGAGSRTGSTVPLDGTSVAAPQVTRWVADQLATGGAAQRADFEAFALGKEAALPPGKPPLPAERSGTGRDNFPDTMQGPRTRYWAP
jgi:Subtilase family